MNEMQLLQRWPGWAGRTPREIMDSPAWSMRTRWGDDETRLRFSDNRPRDVLGLKIAFDDEEHFLGIGEREAFPDLAALWDRKSDLPGTLMLALVEKECGKLLQLLENAVRRQLRVIGLAEASEREGTRGMEVVGEGGGIGEGVRFGKEPPERHEGEGGCAAAQRTDQGDENFVL